MASKYLQKKWQKVTLAIVLGFTIFILVVAIFVNSYWSPILESKVKDIVTASSDSLYKVDFSSAELHVLRGTIVINNITLKPDTAVYNARKRLRLAPNNLIELHVKKLIFSHVHPLNLYFRQQLNIGKVLVYNPELNVSYQLNHTRDTVIKDNRTPWQKISKSLHFIHIGDILMGDVKFSYKDYSGHKLAISEFKEMNLSAHDLLIDSATQTDKSRLLYCKDITAELNNYKAKTPNGLYVYTIKSVKLSTSKSQLNLTGVTVKPAATDVFFNRTHKDRFTLSLDSVQLNNFDFLSYHKYRTLTAARLLFHNGSFQVFANPNHSPKIEDKINSFPNVAMNNVAIDIKIDSVLFNRINVIYNEFNVKTKKTGTLTFNNTGGVVTNFTNNKAALQKNDITAVAVHSYFMNRGKLDVAFNFNITDKNNSFTYKGTLGPMNAQEINKATMPLAMVKVNAGTIKQFNFDIKADRSGAKGSVELLYNDVKVSLLKTTVNDNLTKKLVESLYANIFILKHNNPDNPGEQPRIAYVNFIRRPDDAFFNSVWQVLLEGIKPSVGLDDKTLKSIAQMQDQRTLDSQNRKIKKAQRKQRRAERRKKRLETGG